MNLALERVPSARSSLPPETALELPFDFQPVAGRARQIESFRFALPHGLPAACSNAPAPETWDMLTAAFGVLLARYNGQPAISLTRLRTGANAGTPERLTLEISAADTCSEVLEHVRQRFGARPLRADAGPPGPAEGARVALIWLDLPLDAEPGPGHPDADLTLLIGANTDGHAAFIYDQSLFRRSSIERFAGHLGVLLASFNASPDALVGELPLLQPQELRWLEDMCNGARHVAPSVPVHELVGQQAVARPQAVALRFREQALTYRELAQRSDQLARELLERNIGSGCPIVVCVEPAFEIVIALLGILKAGAAYVPVDPSYPSARIQAILADTRPELVITQPHLQNRLNFGGAALLLLDAGTPVGSFGIERKRLPTVDPSQPASIFYTSGTTGSPKGVVASHANLSHYLRSAQQRYQINARDLIPAIARFSFSISMFELLSPLIAGGTLLLLEREHILDPARMASSLGEVTFFHAGPSLLKGLVSYIRGHYPDFSAFSGIRHASSGGDMVPAELLERLKEIFTNAEVFVIYGSSEISCMGCTYPVPREHRITTSYVGSPFENVRVRVLDGAQQVLPAGIVGEIYFAGQGVTLGYLNRPELTAKQFIMLDGQRFYRTGDRGRLSHEGSLEILGRNDYQVKIRGMRVELAEVEYHLRAAPGVRDAAAAARPGADGEKVLVAYIVREPEELAPRSQPGATVAAIRRHLAAQLPDYMLPAVYVELERLPLNHNLKLDRQALPQPVAADLRAALGTTLRAAQTATERTLAAIWQQLLGGPQVGRDDNFFELGGHSLLAVQFRLEVEQQLGVRLDSMDILREPLLVLAAICDRHRGSHVPSADAESVAPRARESVALCHFGPENSLYGVFHESTGAARRAVLICGAVAEEQVRARFVLKQLAKQLARDGVPSFLFDYFGCGDSLGEGSEASLGRWRADIVHAHAELQRRCPGARITAIGVRLGAALLCQVAPELNIEQLLLWDPVCDGLAHHAELAQMQRAYLRSISDLGVWRFWRRRAQQTGQELLGTSYSAAGLRELQALRIGPWLSRQHAPIRSLHTALPSERAAPLATLSPDSGLLMEHLDYDCGWQDVARLEDVIPDVRLSSTLAAWVQEAP